MCRPAAAWQLSIGESSTPQTPGEPPGERTGHTKSTAQTKAHSIAGRPSCRRPMSSGVRGDLLLGHQEREKVGLSRERGIKRNAMSIYAAKALHRPKLRRLHLLKQMNRPTVKYRLQNPNKLLSLGR
ncbi:MAG: hypothetical protein LBF27_31505 [Sphingobacterium sp.]|nr:hypothetical protein [Sphingobacterium sp.]